MVGFAQSASSTRISRLPVQQLSIHSPPLHDIGGYSDISASNAIFAGRAKFACSRSRFVSLSEHRSALWGMADAGHLDSTLVPADLYRLGKFLQPGSSAALADGSPSQKAFGSFPLRRNMSGEFILGLRTSNAH